MSGLRARCVLEFYRAQIRRSAYEAGGEAHGGIAECIANVLSSVVPQGVDFDQ